MFTLTTTTVPIATRARVAHKSRQVRANAHANAARLAPAHITREVAQIAAKKPPPPPPPAKFVSEAQYVQAATVVFGTHRE